MMGLTYHLFFVGDLLTGTSHTSRKHMSISDRRWRDLGEQSEKQFPLEVALGCALGDLQSLGTGRRYLEIFRRYDLRE